ncbi:hypothetical protein GOP47_0028344 [Adiantum capillus-veneris]|nr:hypothetical protein GOP47_0028344 [Adiantum capillus-veneris]
MDSERYYRSEIFHRIVLGFYIQLCLVLSWSMGHNYGIGFLRMLSLYQCQDKLGLVLSEEMQQYYFGHIAFFYTPAFFYIERGPYISSHLAGRQKGESFTPRNCPWH